MNEFKYLKKLKLVQNLKESTLWVKKLVYSGIIGHVTCKESDLALAVTSDGNINQLGDGDNGNLGVQDDAK